MKVGKPVLLVEDDDVDARIVGRASRDLHMINPLARARTGEEALAWLRDEANATPCLILLDLHLPVMSGIEFLRIAKADARLRRIPVVVLTSSRLETDKVASFDLSVAGYFVKPLDYEQFLKAIKAVHSYWTLCETS